MYIQSITSSEEDPLIPTKSSIQLSTHRLGLNYYVKSKHDYYIY